MAASHEIFIKKQIFLLLQNGLCISVHAFSRQLAGVPVGTQQNAEWQRQASMIIHTVTALNKT